MSGDGLAHRRMQCCCQRPTSTYVKLGDAMLREMHTTAASVELQTELSWKPQHTFGGAGTRSLSG